MQTLDIIKAAGMSGLISFLMMELMWRIAAKRSPLAKLVLIGLIAPVLSMSVAVIVTALVLSPSSPLLGPVIMIGAAVAGVCWLVLAATVRKLDQPTEKESDDDR